MRWAELPGRRVGVWGVGIEGGAAIEVLDRLGVEHVDVRADDDTSVLFDCDLVLKSPGISRHGDVARRLLDAGIEVTSGLSLWLAEVGAERVVGVTGTKGKSTTATLIGHLLRAAGRDVEVVGNIGRSPLTMDASPDVWVLEVSSFQAADLATGPHLVALTSLHVDHLDWHGSVQQYHDDKLSLCTKPGVERVLANGEDEVLRHALVARGIDATLVERDDSLVVPALPGAHNVANASLAVAVVRALGADASAGALASFEALPGRLQVVGTVDGVRFVDDGLSTNVLSTRAALDAFAGERVALLAGGFDRGIDYRELVDALAARDDVAVFALGDAGRRIAEAAGVAGSVQPDLRAAVRAAFEWARPEGVVLLSPAAPSFDAFADHRERSAAFRAAMEEASGWD